MLLSLVLHTYSMRYLLPSVVLLGTAPTYVLAWGVWRLLSAFLPSRFYQALDDRLYCVYQSMVLFFFENYTGVQVSRLPLPGLGFHPSSRGSGPLRYPQVARVSRPARRTQPGEHVPSPRLLSAHASCGSAEIAL
ncbi:hypothetical protein P7K49_027711 [Saguinus oedipus]|uniref:1-acyl-sn-glycerol-3-phosphate acyltransferase epsilon n=1 Tax=Saguinus oedipus TaxID=9490 RepID=A0ABQ9UA91_SAGOE|nr:hypothetical protein P7K49_027711 [Saguinus oedipus]